MPADVKIPHGALVTLSTYVLGSGTLDDMLGLVCSLTVEVVPGADEATVNLVMATTPAATDGHGSSMSFPLPFQGESIGTLDVHARKANAFDDTAVAMAQRFATLAAVAVGNVISYLQAAQTAVQMQAAMASRAVIEQAKGIIMARVGCDADRAFALLVQQSQHENRKLRDVATETVERVTRNAK